MDIEYIIERITPRADCRACGGLGMVSAGSVPYGSTWVSLPDEYCECVTEQAQYEDSEIEIVLSDAVASRYLDAQGTLDNLY